MWMNYNGALVEVIMIKMGVAIILYKSGVLDLVVYSALEYCN